MNSPIAMEKTEPPSRTGYSGWWLVAMFILGAASVACFALACADPIDQPSAPHSRPS